MVLFFIIFKKKGMIMIKMDETKNKEIKQRLVTKKIEGRFVFAKPSYMPFIGDKYVNAKILFIGNQKIELDEDVVKNGNRRNFPSFNVCCQIIDLNEKLKKFVESELKTKIENVAYYNFFFDRTDSGVFIPNSGAKGKELARYHQALALVIKELKPRKIIFWGRDVLTKVNRAKRPCGFDGATFDEYVRNEKIDVELINIHNISASLDFRPETSLNDKSELEMCIADIRTISIEMYETLKCEFDSNPKQMRALNRMYLEDISPSQELFAEGMFIDNMGTWSFFMCLKLINKIRRSLIRLQKEISEKKVYRSKDELKMERTIFYSQWMLFLLEKSNLFIAHTLVPTMLKYIEKTFELDDEMIAQLDDGGKTPSIEEFREYLKTKPKNKACGVGKILKGVYRHFKHNPDLQMKKFAPIMEKRIFIGAKGRQFVDLVNKKTLEALKSELCATIWTPNSSVND